MFNDVLQNDSSAYSAQKFCREQQLFVMCSQYPTHKRVNGAAKLFALVVIKIQYIELFVKNICCSIRAKYSPGCI